MHVLSSLPCLIIAFALIHPAVAEDTEAEPSAAFRQEPSAAFRQDPSAVSGKEPSAAFHQQSRARQVIKEMEHLYRGQSSRSTITMKVARSGFCFFPLPVSEKRPWHRYVEARPGNVELLSQDQ